MLHLKRTVIDLRTGIERVNSSPVGFNETLVWGGQEYRLAGVVAHVGGSSFGHYFTLRRGAGGWHMVSDEVSQESSFERVRRERAYMLFYEKA